jgi:hypothetical protein
MRTRCAYPIDSSMKAYLFWLGVRIGYTQDPIKMFFVVRKINMENVDAGRFEVLTVTLKIKSLLECRTVSAGKQVPACRKSSLRKPSVLSKKDIIIRVH